MSILAPAAVPSKTAPPPTPRLLFAAGWDAYDNWQPLEELSDPIMRRGWLAANEAEGEFVTAGYLAKAVA